MLEIILNHVIQIKADLKKYNFIDPSISSTVLFFLEIIHWNPMV